MGISEDERHRLVRLGSLGEEVRQALAERNLGLRHQLAVADAPVARQIEFILAATALEGAPSVLVMEGAARVLAKVRPTISAADVITTAERAALSGSKKAAALAEQIVAQLAGGDISNSDAVAAADASVAVPVVAPQVRGDEGAGKDATGKSTARPVALGTRRQSSVAPSEGIITEVAEAVAGIMAQVQAQLRGYSEGGQVLEARQFLDAITSGLDDAYLEVPVR